MSKSIANKITRLSHTILEALSAGNKPVIIGKFTRTGTAILEADFGFAWWRIGQEKNYRLIYKSPNTPYEPNLPRERGGNYEARKKRTPIFVSEVRSKNYKKGYDVSPYMKSYVIVPVSYQDQLYGSIVICYQKKREFSDEDKSLALALGNAAAQVVTISRLNRDIRQANAELDSKVRKRTRELSEVNDRLKEVDRQRETLVYMASHELKTPITSLRGFAQLLMKRIGKKADPSAKSYLQRIDKQSDRLIKLVNDLLAVTQLRAGRLEFKKTRFDLGALVRETVEIFQKTSQHEILIKGNTPGPVLADRGRIQQALDNYLSNAIKYSPKSSKIIVGLGKERGFALVKVRDFGMGVGKDSRRKVFDLFSRDETVSRTTIAGFGLGLYIVSEIIKAHGGRVGVKSAAPRGSTFYFLLPLAGGRRGHAK